jgi:hypothetical protein
MPEPSIVVAPINHITINGNIDTILKDDTIVYFRSRDLDILDA